MDQIVLVLITFVAATVNGALAWLAFPKQG